MAARARVDSSTRILEAALRVFEKKGFDGSRTKEIAEEAGLSEAAIFKVFPTKKHLLLALIDPFIETVLRPALMNPAIELIQGEESRSKSVPQVLGELSRERVGTIKAQQSLAKTLALEAFRHEEVFAALKERVLPQIVSNLESLFQRGKDEGSIEAHSTVALIRGYVSLIFGHIILDSIAPELFSEDPDTDLDALMELFLEGAAKRTGDEAPR